MDRIGLIGCGKWGANILRDLIRLNCQVHVADIDATARSRAKTQGAWQVFSNSLELPFCDGYVVAVPIPDLTPECVKLLKFRKPIFAEKTLCLSLDDVHLLRSSGGQAYVFCMHKWHYHPGIEALRLVGQTGKIGAIREVRTTRHAWVDDFHGGDVFWTQAVHDLTIIKHILGRIPSIIKKIDVVIDQNGLPVSFSATLGDSPIVTMSVSGRESNRFSSVSIHSETGSAELHDAYDNHITVRSAASTERLPIDTTFPLFLELQEFVVYLNGGHKPRCNLNAAEEVTRAILNLRNKAGLSHPFVRPG